MFFTGLGIMCGRASYCVTFIIAFVLYGTSLKLGCFNGHYLYPCCGISVQRLGQMYHNVMVGRLH